MPRSRATDLTTDMAVDRADALAERLLEATVGTLELYSVYLGRELGLYRCLADHGPLTGAELAERTAIGALHAAEWLEQQAVAGLLDVVAGERAGARRYGLDAAHARVLTDVDDPASLSPLAQMVAGVGGALGQVVDAYRTGGGVPDRAYGRAFRHGQGHVSRASFAHELVGEWIAAMPDVVARLERAPRARVADVGCGQGFAALALAGAFLNVHVDGIDADAASIDDARRNAVDSGLDGRVRFLLADAGEITAHRPYELVVVLDALHDMVDPLGALRALRGALAPDGAGLVVEERRADGTGPGDRGERMVHGWAVTHRLPARLAERAPTPGAALDAGTVRSLAAQAGFARVDSLDIDHPRFRLYRLDP